MTKFNEVIRLVAIVATMLFTTSVFADSAEEIDRDVDRHCKPSKKMLTVPMFFWIRVLVTLFFRESLKWVSA